MITEPEKIEPFEYKTIKGYLEEQVRKTKGRRSKLIAIRRVFEKIFWNSPDKQTSNKDYSMAILFTLKDIEKRLTKIEENMR